MTHTKLIPVVTFGEQIKKKGLIVDFLGDPVVQWLRLCLPMQETLLPDLGRSHMLQANKSMHPSY